MAKVNDMYHIPKLADSHHEIIRFDITVDERFVVDVFDAGDQLIDNHEDYL